MYAGDDAIVKENFN